MSRFLREELIEKWTAGLFSFLLPGLGQAYCRSFVMALLYFVAFTALNMARVTRPFVVVVALVAALDAFYRAPARRMEAPFRGRKAVYSVVGIVALVAWVMLWVPTFLPPFELSIDMNDEVDQLATRVRKFRNLHGAYPGDLSQCVLTAGEALELLTDPWGSPYKISALSTGFEIRSAGKDRTLGSDDDVVFTFR